jgi:hypothetical protein
MVRDLQAEQVDDPRENREDFAVPAASR